MATAIPAEIQDALSAGKTVLTANQRAARTLRRAFDSHQKSTGKISWTPPEIFALETWLANLWHQRLIDGAETRLLLNPLQEQALWREIIAADREVSGLRSADALAEMASQAWHLLNRHNGRARLREFNVSTDTRAFARWAEQFERLCARNNYLSAAQLPLSLRSANGLSFRSEAEESAVRLGSLLLVDFDALTPAISTLFTGSDIDEFRTAIAPSSASLFPASDSSAEMHSAARWAAAQLAANPAASIAIVVPDLADRRAQLDRVFHACVPDRYEFSLGGPLAETTLVATALDLLGWPLQPLPLDAISQLLLSPFFGAAAPEQTLAAAEFDAFEVRRATLLRPELSLQQMIDLVANSRHRSQPLTGLRIALYRMRNTAAEENLVAGQAARQSHSGWADTFRRLLDATGLREAAQSTSLTFQMLRSWESALDSLATLDFAGDLVPSSAALNTLTRIARNTTFAPESANAPVQIVGPLEPGGVPFDALWFLGADDLTWSATSVANPMLPWHIQREFGIPGADPVRDVAQAEALTQRLAQSAPQIVFSYAQHDEDGHRRPSPLLRSLNLVPFIEPAAETSPPLPLETFVDAESIPPLAPDGIVRGGARVLELQAACAFRAFAEIRLQSTEPDGREPGLDARDRGIQVHRIMQAFWTQVQSQETLKAMPRADRDALLDACINENLTKIPGAPSQAASSSEVGSVTVSSWEAAYLNIQRQRLRDLLNPWLNFELTRPTFTVRQQEEKATVQIGPLQLEVRADRIDETVAGPLILDYKTGVASPAQWTSDRPDAPQLPLYAVLAATQDQPLAGVAFALLRAGEGLSLKGFADSPAVLEERARMSFPSLDEQVEDWHRVLTHLAESFAHAEPVADPKQYPQTCKRCGQRMLCRLDPAALEADEEDEPEPAHV